MRGADLEVVQSPGAPEGDGAVAIGRVV